MGMVPPETAARLMAPTGRERRRWDSLRPASPNGGECGWASSLLSYCDLARRRDVDCRPSLQLFQPFQRPHLVRVVPRHGRSVNRVACITEQIGCDGDTHGRPNAEESE